MFWRNETGLRGTSLGGLPPLASHRSKAAPTHPCLEHRLLTLALEDAEDTAEAEAILRAHEPRVSWERLKAGSASPAQAHEP